MYLLVLISESYSHVQRSVNWQALYFNVQLYRLQRGDTACFNTSSLRRSTAVCQTTQRHIPDDINLNIHALTL